MQVFYSPRSALFWLFLPFNLATSSLKEKAEYSLLRMKAIGSLVIAWGSVSPCWCSAILSRQAVNVKRDSSPVSLSSVNPGFSSISKRLRQEKKPEASAAAKPRQSDASSRTILIGRLPSRKYSLSDVILNKKWIITWHRHWQRRSRWVASPEREASVGLKLN